MLASLISPSSGSSSWGLGFLGSVLTTQQVYDYARQAGFDPAHARSMVAISLRESSNDPSVIGTIAPGEASYGLWQINMGSGLGPTRLSQFGISSPDQLKDPLTNAKAAFALYGGNDSNIASAWQINNFTSPFQYGQKYQTNLSNLPPVTSLESGYSGPSGIMNLDDASTPGTVGLTLPPSYDLGSHGGNEDNYDQYGPFTLGDDGVAMAGLSLGTWGLLFGSGLMIAVLLMRHRNR